MSISPLPEGMLQRERLPVQRFEPAEFLYRRIPPQLWDRSPHRVDVDAINLPDMSVGRSRFGHPEWLRLAPGCDAWAVVGFRIALVPTEQRYNGLPYLVRAIHVPLRRDYPHSEVQLFDRTGAHVDGKALPMPDEVNLAWREKLLRVLEVFLLPEQPAIIRTESPNSHVPELPIPLP